MASDRPLIPGRHSKYLIWSRQDLSRSLAQSSRPFFLESRYSEFEGASYPDLSGRFGPELVHHWRIGRCSSDVVLDEVLIVVGCCFAEADFEVFGGYPLLLASDVVLAILLRLVADVR
jgi:hypothetical protein